jgi:leishmanolysin-like peptidase
MGKAHFGCSTLNGVELENGGGPSTAGSHWEARILHEEIMVSSSEFQGYRNGVSLRFALDLTLRLCKPESGE